MEVILLERVAKLGQMGEVVRVKDGFARNFLLKRGKALRATADNRARFDGMKAELEARNLQARGEPTKVAEKIDGRNVVVLRQASETGQLFGSVSIRDIITSFESDGVGLFLQFEVARFQLHLHAFELGAVILGGAQRLALREQEIARETVLDADDFAHLTELGDAFEQDHFHVGLSMS